MLGIKSKTRTLDKDYRSITECSLSPSNSVRKFDLCSVLVMSKLCRSDCKTDSKIRESLLNSRHSSSFVSGIDVLPPPAYD